MKKRKITIKRGGIANGEIPMTLVVKDVIYRFDHLFDADPELFYD